VACQGSAPLIAFHLMLPGQSHPVMGKLNFPEYPRADTLGKPPPMGF
jgi:hypothetical protein